MCRFHFHHSNFIISFHRVANAAKWNWMVKNALSHWNLKFLIFSLSLTLKHTIELKLFENVIPDSINQTGLSIHWKKSSLFSFFLSFFLTLTYNLNVRVQVCAAVVVVLSSSLLLCPFLFEAHTHFSRFLLWFGSIVLFLMYVLLFYDKVRIAIQLKCDCQVSKRVFATYKTVIVSFSLICFRQYYIYYTLCVLCVFDTVCYVCMS